MAGINELYASLKDDTLAKDVLLKNVKMKMEFYKWKKSEPELSIKMLEILAENFSRLCVEEADLLIIAKVGLTDKLKISEEDITEFKGEKYAKLFFP